MKHILFLSIIFFSLNCFSQLRIDSNNKIGMGITNPSEKLHVVGNAVFTSTTFGPNSSPFIVGSEAFSTPTTPNYTWYLYSNTGMYHPTANSIGFSLNGNESMLLSPGSIKINAEADWVPTLYINATSPNQGGFNMRLNGQDNFWVQANGLVNHRGLNNLSDKRLKKDIQTIKNPLNKVLQLRGVTFYWKDTENIPEKCMGFIAQEVEPIIPEVVRTTHKGMKAVQYSSLIGLLVEAIKEQQIQINELKEKLNINNELSSDIDNVNNNYFITKLHQNNPNPFTEKTEIKYSIPKKFNHASIFIYNMNGVQIKEVKIKESGNASIFINGFELEAGMYLYTLIVDGKEINTKRMILTK